MANKTVYLRSSGAETVAYEDQVTPELWHIPPKATEVKPPSFTDKQTCQFIDDKWVVADIPEPEPEPEPEPPELTYADKRRNEYPSIPDQLDEIYHNGIDSWKAVIKVTKDKYPKG